MKPVYLYSNKKIMTREVKYMMEAIALSKKAIDNNEGGPFGCIVVKNDKIIGRGNNKVIVENDSKK